MPEPGLPRIVHRKYIPHMIKLTEAQCHETMSGGEVAAEVIAGNFKVAVIFTQSWCGDWMLMRRYVGKIENTDVSVYYIEYDREPFYEKMRQFKETVFRNWGVPYVRYFRDGKLVATSNLLFTKRGFLKRLES